MISPRSLVRRLIWALGLEGLRFRLWEIGAARAHPGAARFPDGKPMPPAILRVMVVGNADPDYFASSGQNTLAEFDALLSATGLGLGQARTILDIGCGCGRLARWLPPEAADRLIGVDINARLLAWSRRHLPGAWRRVELGAPLPVADASIEALYACSVITHLRESTAADWLADLSRVLTPGGQALITFHDLVHAARGGTPPPTLAAEGYGVRFDSHEGSNLLSAYVTAERLAELAGPDLTLVTHRSSSETFCGQAIAVFRKV
ncbi:hypothetical protein ASD79_04765 [Caulobacter sp. Root655]|uniref:class I SAM-dependent methyltransferase n=1 Tax=Caulobacter sp. Root655 TaxID=1736578 RepID=UPI0006FB92D5|nr:class I SAM-dependent methyltransferase [Caulobacter sp. Root655]KRA61440.1 hypothetical protein ASD79_04765 [Caulobacter sp. Root655]